MSTLNRRSLLKASLLAGGGFMLQYHLPASAQNAEDGVLVRSDELNAWVKITPDGQITIYSSIPEMGQGIMTTLPMVIAEEMGARWADVEVINAPVEDRFGLQGAGGSRSVPTNLEATRRVGASAREMLIGAAALLMEVDREQLEARDSEVVHSSGERRTFGQLARLAAEQPVPEPEFLTFKDPRAYTIIGKAITGVENLVIATGGSEFGIDVDVPGMRYATYSRCPRVGGTAVSFNAAEIKALPGITDAFILAPDDRPGDAQMAFLKGLPVLRGGVAIVGEDTWSVLDAKAKLKVQWDDASASNDSWAGMIAQAKEIATAGGGEVRKDSEAVDAAFADAANRTAEAFYEYPFVSHICMEPMNCTADYRKGKGDAPDTLEIWLGSQFPAQVREVAHKLTGVEEANVTVHGMRMGGGFGRRAIHDFAAEAIAISHRAGVPVKLTWTRTDDIHNDFMRAGGFASMKGAVGKDGRLAAWDQHYIGVKHKDRGIIGSGMFGNEFPLTAMDNARVRLSMMDIVTPCGAWRAPGSNQCFRGAMLHS